ncbi:MAG: 30S ribosomal protein S3 [Nitrosarchaeum sp.]|jgi:small subunit ribosomal protein S3|nr:30S ribosomal protein S3 [Nitrosarchaeum sp.]MBP0120404.1 30S ribosomal protein S3 [Nitrosarchaeum sp.]MBP0134553.1 30S ribosomal protein S3 [Nitrosarchaeum sp.]MSV26457.1 30S ribosomal protein S3 [Nitrosarchaeum sp.]PHY09057.1 MAG: 30S ribosomal protein S3 [Nitrosarchaeum sp.]
MSAVKNVIKDNYNMMLLKDYLRVAIKDAGFSHAEISKTPTGTRVVLHVTRPGIVIGRKGTGIRELTEKLASEFKLKNPQIAVEEIAKPELSPSVMCNRMASHLERGTAFRRATMWTLKQIMENGAMGVQITISGKLRGDRSAFEKHAAGILPRAGHHAEVIVDEDIVHVRTAMGLIGIRIRIARTEKLIPEFEFKTQKTKKLKQIKDTDTGKMRDETEGERKARTESEQIVIEEEKMKELETLEEEEAKLL